MSLYFVGSTEPARAVTLFSADRVNSAAGYRTRAQRKVTACRAHFRALPLHRPSHATTRTSNPSPTMKHFVTLLDGMSKRPVRETRQILRRTLNRSFGARTR